MVAVYFEIEFLVCRSLGLNVLHHSFYNSRMNSVVRKGILQHFVNLSDKRVRFLINQIVSMSVHV